MTEVEEIEEMIRTRSQPPERRSKRLWRRFVTHLGRTPTMKGVYLGAVFVAIGFELVLLQFQTINDRNRADDQRAVAQDIYVAKIIGYGQAVSAYQICLDGVARSDQNRAQWMQLADIIAALESGSGEATSFAEQIRTGPLLSTPPRLPKDCVSPGEPPSPPPSTS